MRSTWSRREFAALLAGGLLLGGRRARALEVRERSESWEFGVIADAQFCDCPPRGTRHYRASREKLAKCVEELNRHDLEFVIHLGDFIDRGFASFDALLPVYARLKAPRYHVLGNHDFDVADERKEDVPEKLGLSRRYYHFTVRGMRFIALDGNDISLHGRPAGSPEHAAAREMLRALGRAKAPQAQAWNGALGPAQLDWLDATLDGAEKAGEPAVVFCHFPVYPADAHNLWNAAEVLRILDGHSSPIAYLSGHNHAGAYGERRGVHHLTVEGMVETADTTAYARIAVSPDKLEVVGYGRVPKRRLSRGGCRGGEPEEPSARRSARV